MNRAETLEKLRGDYNDALNPDVLTPEEKLYELFIIERLLESEEIDEDIIPFMKKINSFPFIVTTQSCSGHNNKKNKYEKKYGKDGYLELRFSLIPTDIINFFLRPLDKKFAGDLLLQIIFQWKGKTCYVLRFHNKNRERILTYFVFLLERYQSSN